MRDRLLMHACSPHPLRDLFLWLRWILAACVVLGLPGFLLVGRFVRGLDALGRCVLSFGAGALLMPLLGLVADALHLPFTTATALPAAVVLAWLVGRIRPHREAVSAWGEQMPRWPAAAQAAIAACCALAFALILVGMGDLCAPPHVHDASNHAWFTLRVQQARSMSPAAVFGGASGVPDFTYFMGLHAVAALLGELSGVAAYISVWYLAVACVALAPAALALLWSAWGASTEVALLGALLVAVNRHVPSGLLGWGGFGLAAAMTLTPTLVVAGRACLLRPSRWQGALFAGMLAALVQIHAGDVAVVLALVGLSAAMVRQAPVPADRPSLHRHVDCWLAAGVVAAILVALPAWSAGRAYTHLITSRPQAPDQRLGPALEQVMSTGGGPGALRYLALLGWLIAAWSRRLRPLVLASLLLGVFYVAVAAWGDPVSRALAMPFYGEAARVRYLQVYVMPPLMAFALVRLAQWLLAFARRRRKRSLVPMAWAVAWGALIATIAPALPAMVINYRNMRQSVPFGPQEYALARRMAQVVGPDELIANFYDDGSTWAMHVSGRRFLQPAGWGLAQPGYPSTRQRVFALLRQPWDEEARSLQTMGVHLVYVSDWTWPHPGVLGISRSDFDRDPRFVPVLREGAAALYRIRWDDESGTSDPPRRTTGTG